MNRKYFCRRLVKILTIFVFCLFLDTAIEAQQDNYYKKSLKNLFDDFETIQKLPCGQRDEAVKIGKIIIEKISSDELNNETNNRIIDWVKKQVFVVEEEDSACKTEQFLELLYENFKVAKKLPCGDRYKAILIGKKILELYSNDSENQDVIYFVKTNTAKIEEQDRICNRNNSYNQSYKYKSWNEFFTISKQIIAEEGNKPLALDVMLTLVSVGFGITAYEKSDSFNIDTKFYAEKAIELIEDGVKTQSCYGLFECYKSKENALGWLNYTIGYISYFRLKENKKAVKYFYQATKYNTEFKYDAFVYQAVAIYYFDKSAVTTSSLTINDFITKASNLGLAEETNNFTEQTAKNNELAALYKQLINLYNLRYNLEPDENVTDLADYIQKLINSPLIDPSAKIYRKK